MPGSKRKAVAQRTSQETRGGPSPRRHWDDDQGGNQEAIKLKVQVDDPEGTSWVPTHRTQAVPPVPEGYRPPSPTAKRLKAPRAREERLIGASAARQALLTGFRVSRQVLPTETWLPTEVAVPELVLPVSCTTKADLGMV